ncbi:MAG TPA: bifunctional D-glycero-beta-D-manno-heptose-7-phosphate kinase/D-glycero-beta-D-manno-heptose 1-phosphate adenylyltransferase HldE [Syntrophobacteraceae bacterium]|nr:bifunctional D-glycero-beta-D-manno-heptose-7-phosphate kinase/D-glycero-beta-D-manno-heptose 1-phosphate adenylyltransferase HldE [Syntrophobacteraceae bacterium]
MITFDLSVLNKVNALVVGDVMLDRYLWGRTTRISPEAPVPVVKVESRTYRLGGAALVAANLAALGCRVRLVGAKGADGHGERLSNLLAESGIEDHLFALPAPRPTIVKTRVMSQGQQLLRLDEEETETIGPSARDALVDRILELIADAGVVILSDYGKGALDKILCAAVIESAGRRFLPTLVDPKGKDWTGYNGATCITPNTAELELTTGKKIDSEQTLLDAGRGLFETLRIHRLLVTRGPKGMALFARDEPPLLIPTLDLDVFDVSGAGDTVIATVAAAIAAGLDWPQAAELANIAAGIVVRKLGANPVRAEDLAIALRQGQNGTQSKICDISSARLTIEAWKAGGSTVVFTNGCFDLLHAGHIRLLHSAAAEGTRLVVGLNSDSSVRRIKGAHRPILPQQDRAALLAALGCVDLVVVFEEDTPLRLIEALRPDVLVKGADYARETVVGHELVEGWGGRVVLVPLLENLSTTGIVERLKGDKAPAKPGGK